MKHYKDAAGNLFAYAADGSQDHAIKPGLTLIPDTEKEDLVQKKAKELFDKEDYYRKRLYSYPEIGEFLDAWVKGDENALEEYKRKCLEVKAKYPKPEGF